MRIITLLAFLLMAFFAQAQTKLIAHKSHSGSTQTFHKTLDDAFLGNHSNYGLAPSMNKDKTLDTVYIEKNQVVGIVSFYCENSSSFKEIYICETSSLNISSEGEKTNFKSKKQLKNHIASYMERDIFLNTPDEVFYKGFDEDQSKEELEKELKKSERKKKSLGTQIKNTTKRITKIERDISKLRRKTSLNNLDIVKDVKKLKRKIDSESRKSKQLKNQLKRYQRKAARIKRQIGLK